MPILLTAKWLIPLVHTLTLAVLPVVVETTDGKKIRGELSGITADKLLVTAAGSTQELSFDDLVSMERTDFTPKVPPATNVAFANGSRVFTGGLTFDGQGVLISPRRQAPLLAPVKKLRSIRFRKSSAETDAQWLGLANVESKRDTLVIRRPGNRLDPQEGIILAIKDAIVVFDLDGTEIDAPMNQLEGIVFGGKAEVEKTPPLRLTDIYGSTWLLTSIKTDADGESLNIQIDDSLEHAIPMDQVARIDWSSGVLLLSAEKPSVSKFTPYLATNVAPDLVDRFFGPRQQGEADLQMNGGSVLEYRLDPEFKRFAGAVVRGQADGVNGALKVNIKLDDKLVWSESLTDAQPRGFDIETGKARKVRLEVGLGGDGDAGDNIRLLRPRLLK